MLFIQQYISTKNDMKYKMHKIIHNNDHSLREGEPLSFSLDPLWLGLILIKTV